MSRPRYTNVPPSKVRDRLLEEVCGYLRLDPAEHSSRVQALDYGLRVAAQGSERDHKLVMLGYNQALLDHAEFPIRGEDGEVALEREAVKRIVAQLREELEK